MQKIKANETYVKNIENLTRSITPGKSILRSNPEDIANTTNQQNFHAAFNLQVLIPIS